MFNLPTNEDIKNYRKKAGLTQTQLARKSNLSQSLIARIESNSVDPRLSTIRKIIDAIEETMKLKKTVKDLLEYKNKERTKLPSLVHLTSASKVSEAIALMKKFGISQLPVIDNGKPVGSIIESNLLDKALQKKDLSEISLLEVMTDPFPLVNKSTKLEDANKLFMQGYTAILVMDEGKVCGILTKIDILSYTTM